MGADDGWAGGDSNTAVGGGGGATVEEDDWDQKPSVLVVQLDWYWWKRSISSYMDSVDITFPRMKYFIFIKTELMIQNIKNEKFDRFGVTLFCVMYLLLCIIYIYIFRHVSFF